MKTREQQLLQFFFTYWESMIPCDGVNMLQKRVILNSLINSVENKYEDFVNNSRRKKLIVSVSTAGIMFFAFDIAACFSSFSYFSINSIWSPVAPQAKQ